MATEFIELAGKVNQQMPYHCVERIERALNDATKPVKGSQILILGASYKGGVGDIRESPSLRIMEVLKQRGGLVNYHDSYVPALPELGLESVPLEAVVDEADAVVLVTAHPGVDYAALAERSSLFIDLRGVTRGVRLDNLVGHGSDALRSRRISRARARSSVGERSLHTREVAGSSPAVPITKVPVNRHFFVGRLGGKIAGLWERFGAGVQLGGLNPERRRDGLLVGVVEPLDRTVELARFSSLRSGPVVALGSGQLPARSALGRLVGESHQRPDGLLVDVAAGRDLLVDREGERRADVPDLRGDPLGVAADHRRERRPCAPQRVWRDRAAAARSPCSARFALARSTARARIRSRKRSGSRRPPVLVPKK